MDLTLARVDVSADGQLSAADVEEAQRLVEATKSELLNDGVIAALILSIMYPMAYEEKDALTSLHESQASWGWGDWSGLLSLLANFASVSTAIITVFLTSIMYTQLSFWMPTLEARLWYVGMSHFATSITGLAKNMTIFASLLTLALETAVTKSAMDYIAFMPLLTLLLTAFAVTTSLNRKCKAYLASELIKVDPLSS